MNADQVRSLQPALAALLESFRGCFAKEPVFEHLQTYVLGLLTDLKRKSVEPIALAAGVPVRTLQEFLSQLTWDHQRGRSMLQRLVMDRHGCDNGIGVIDASAHAKKNHTGNPKDKDFDKALLGAIHQSERPGGSLAVGISATKCWLKPESADSPQLRQLAGFLRELATSRNQIREAGRLLAASPSPLTPLSCASSRDF
jgi:hypothetical protein